MAKGENAARKHNQRKEFGSRRFYGWISRGRIGKWLTHRRERRQARREIERQLNEATQAAHDHGHTGRTGRHRR